MHNSHCEHMREAAAYPQMEKQTNKQHLTFLFLFRKTLFHTATVINDEVALLEEDREQLHGTEEHIESTE